MQPFEMLAPDSNDKPQVAVQPFIRGALFLAFEFVKVALFTLWRCHATQRKSFQDYSLDGISFHQHQQRV